MNFEDELKKRMALAKQQNWSDQEIQRSAMVERAAYYNRQRQQKTQEQQNKGAGRAGGLKGVVLDLTPFGRVAEKIINPNAGEISAAEIGTEALLTALPFGIGRLAKGARVAKGVITGVKAAEDANKGVQASKGITGALYRKSTIAPSSTIDNATDQARLVDLTKKTPELRGSAARKFQNAPGVISRLSSEVDDLFQGVTAKVPTQKFLDDITNIRKDIVDPNELKRFDIEVNRAMQSTFGKQAPRINVGNTDELAELFPGAKTDFSATDINAIRREVNKQMSGIYKKIENGTQLTDKDQALLRAKQTMDGQLEQIAPDNIRAAVRQNNLDMNTLMKGIPEFKKTSETGGAIGPLGNLFGAGPAINRTIQAGADMTARTLSNRPVQVGLQQAGVRAGAEVMGARNPFKPEDPFDPASMPGMYQNPQSPEEAILAELTAQGGPTDFNEMAQLFDQSQSGMDMMSDPTMGQMGGLQYGSSELANYAMQAFMAGDMASYKQYSTAAEFAAKMEDQQKEIGGGAGGGKIGKDAQKANSAAATIDQLEGLFNQAGGGQGLAGYLQQAMGQARLNPQVEAYDKVRDSAAIAVARALGETGPLSNQDIKMYAKYLPNVNDSKEAAQIKLDAIRQRLSIISQQSSSTSEEDELAALFGGGSQMAYAY